MIDGLGRTGVVGVLRNGPAVVSAEQAELPAPARGPAAGHGSEDVGLLASAAGASCVFCVFWLLGEADPQAFAGATDVAGPFEVVGGLRSNHSRQCAPVPRPTIDTGVAALVSVARHRFGG